VCVIGQIQDPHKEIIDCRHLFSVKIAMRLDEPTQVDMVLGEGVRQRGLFTRGMMDYRRRVA
jgi:DNA segregation ATPase FtsK/SpoIIIE, S-DNA-T family